MHVLLRSTDQSWLSSATDVQPQPDQYPEYGFLVTSERASHPLAVSIHGSFESFFKDRASPFEAGEQVTDTATAQVGTIESSPESSRLVVLGSAEFIDDAVLELSARLSPDRYLRNLELMQNAVDWSVEDEDLLTIRTRGTYARLLKPLDDSEKALWMWLDYGLSLLALFAIGGVWYLHRRGEEPMELVDLPPEQEEGRDGAGAAESSEGGADD